MLMKEQNNSEFKLKFMVSYSWRNYIWTFASEIYCNGFHSNQFFWGIEIAIGNERKPSDVDKIKY